MKERLELPGGLNDTVDMMSASSILSKLEALPEEKQREVLDYIEFLSERYTKLPARPGFSFSWAGGLADLETTSVDLQHKALEWR